MGRPDHATGELHAGAGGWRGRERIRSRLGCGGRNRPAVGSDRKIGEGHPRRPRHCRDAPPRGLERASRILILTERPKHHDRWRLRRIAGLRVIIALLAIILLLRLYVILLLGLTVILLRLSVIALRGVLRWLLGVAWLLRVAVVARRRNLGRLSGNGLHRWAALRDFRTRSRRLAGDHDRGLLHAFRLHKLEQRRRVGGRKSHAAVRRGAAEVPRIERAMNGVADLGKE